MDPPNLFMGSLKGLNDLENYSVKESKSRVYEKMISPLSRPERMMLV